MIADPLMQEHLRNPFAESMNVPAAEAILGLTSSPEVQAYAATLADRSREGELSDDEQRAYEAYADMVSMVSLLQAQARRVLRQSGQK